MSMYGQTPPPWWAGAYEMPRRFSPTLEDICEYEEQLDRLKKKLKEKDEAGKRKKPEPAKVSVASSFFFTLSCLMFFSIPAGMLQLAALTWFRTGVFAVH